jgi:predicted DNA-binding transcriptional regulator YafY
LDVTSLDRDQGIVANSIRQQTTLTFTYFGGSRPGDRRTVLPKQLFRVEGYPCIYLLADDVDLQEERVFRLDRMEW